MLRGYGVCVFLSEGEMKQRLGYLRWNFAIFPFPKWLKDKAVLVSVDFKNAQRVVLGRFLMDGK